MNDLIKSDEKNEFQEKKNLDIDNLLKDEIVNNKIMDNYGDVSKGKI